MRFGQTQERRLQMAVPDFQSMMLPLLEAIADGAEHSNSAAYDLVAKGLCIYYFREFLGVME